MACSLANPSPALQLLRLRCFSIDIPQSPLHTFFQVPIFHLQTTQSLPCRMPILVSSFSLHLKLVLHVAKAEEPTVVVVSATGAVAVLLIQGGHIP